MKNIEKLEYNQCDYCFNNTEEILRGDDGVVESDGTFYIYAEHFRNEYIRIDNIKYCPMCGRKLI